MLIRSKSFFHIYVLIAVLASILGSAVTFTPAYAAGIVVNTDTDKGDITIFDGLCSLREAIANANNHAATYPDCGAGSGTDTITFAGNYTITLPLGQLLITSAITINGNGAANTIIQANVNPNTVHYRVIEVSSLGNLTLNGLTIRNGSCDGSCLTEPTAGAGILNKGALTVSHAIFSDNSASFGGGGIYNLYGNLPLTDVTFSGNSALYGGGIYNYGNPTLASVTFSANSAGYGGGGMYNFSGTPTLTNVTFSSNSATKYGGGMYNSTGTVPTLKNVTFSGNSAVDGGGGIYNDSSSSVTLTNVTFNANTAVSGGGMRNDDINNLTLTNVTFSGNSAISATFLSGTGGGMATISSNLILTNVTFSGNSATLNPNSPSADGGGGGMYNGGNNLTLKNTLIANSPSGGDCVNSIISGSTLNAASSNNLIEDSANACGLSNGVSGNIIGSDPVLDALANNGGFTQTHALLAGSPAINAGDDIACAAVPVNNTSQNGVTRPQGSHCDIGAFESESLASPTPTSISSNTPTATPVPTDTLIPTSTLTPLPTNTLVPTFTSTPIPTITLTPTLTPKHHDGEDDKACKRNYSHHTYSKCTKR